MKLWGGRFSDQPDEMAWKFNASIEFDQRLALQDIRGSIAWSQALVPAGVLSEEEQQLIAEGLLQVKEEFEQGTFQLQEMDEDIHTAVERRLFELIGETAGKLHTGRSRNDQVSTDFRAWLAEAIRLVDQALTGLQTTLVARAESDLGAILPGYTHMQRAMPVQLSHWWLSHFWPLQRDRERLHELLPRTLTLPLGSAALAGTTLDIDREMLQTSLGFQQVSANSMDAVSDRDFAAEFLFCAAMIGIHISKLAEAVVLFSNQEFGFFELEDAFTTGSSIMPQKKNPDIFELARGKSGTLLGRLTGLMATLKALPSTYDKDLQEDKPPVFYAVDTLLLMLPLVSKAIAGIKVQQEVMAAAVSPAMLATHLADQLVHRGVPFRQAHKLVGEAVRMAELKNCQLSELTREEYIKISEAYDFDIEQVFDIKTAIEQHTAIGGTSTKAIKQQIELAKTFL